MQILLNGLLSGLTLGLLALGFAIVYVPTRVFHIAFGGLYLIAPFITWSLLALGFPWPLAVLSGIIVTAAFSLGIEALNYSPLRNKNASAGVYLVSSLGIFIILTQLTALLWGSDVKVLRTGIDQVFNFGAYSLTRAQLIGGIIAGLLLLLFFGWLRWSRLGLQLRALASNEVEIALRGYNVRKLRLTCFGISGLLCACSSLLVAFDTGFSAQVGFPALLLAIVATIVGGKRSVFVGPLIGGLLVSVLRAEVSWVLSSRWQEAAMFVLLIAFLVIWPLGLVARPARVKGS